VKLYRTNRDVNWFAFSSEIGWVRFPAEIGGWQKRQPSPDVSLLDLREIAICMGFNTGIPGAPRGDGDARNSRRRSATNLLEPKG
jgi:hypothetical protein